MLELLMPRNKFGKPKKRVLDQNNIKSFLRKIGFEVELISQEWRHLLAFGKYENNDSVFKLASTQITGTKTKNEFYWNEAVHLVPEFNRPNFTVPKNYSSGHFGKLFYFIAERFTDKPLALRENIDNKYVIKLIPKIAKMTWELENLPIPDDCRFAVGKKSKRQKNIPVGSRVLVSSTEWANQVPKDMSKYLTVIDKIKNQMRTCVGHGDYVIRQMYKYGNKIGIIDGEHAGYKGPIYYDVAQFYIRLRHDYKNTTGMAKQYLLEFKKLLTTNDQNNFWDELKPILIQRFLGECWWNAKNESKLNELMKFGQEILENKII